MGRRQQTDGHRVMEWKEPKKVGFLLIKHGLTWLIIIKNVERSQTTKPKKKIIHIDIKENKVFECEILESFNSTSVIWQSYYMSMRPKYQPY